jgi:hypothetical protein
LLLGTGSSIADSPVLKLADEFKKDAPVRKKMILGSTDSAIALALL